ncbi:MAG: L,D-transpeptidase [Solirubrobacteraceae bacterium]
MFRIVRHALALSAAAAMVSAASAAAATTTATPTVPPTAARGSLTLFLHDAFVVSHQPVSVPRRGVHADGVVRPYVPGQWVTIRAFLGRRLIKRDRLRVKPSANHTFGRFSERIASPGTGTVTVKAAHARTAEQAGFGDQRTFSALDERIGFGSTGRFVELVQQRLAAMHFFLRRSGVYDSGTGLAIDAYHRLLGWGHAQTLDGATISRLLNGTGAFRIRYPRHGRHAEGNLGKQLLALANGSKIVYIFPISSGKPSTPTVLGDFQIYRRNPGYLPDGMYFSSFFIGGYAIHGYDPAPDYPASHGCMRLPIADAITAYNWLTIGNWVDVYY